MVAINALRVGICVCKVSSTEDANGLVTARIIKLFHRIRAIVVFDTNVNKYHMAAGHCL